MQRQAENMQRQAGNQSGARVSRQARGENRIKLQNPAAKAAGSLSNTWKGPRVNMEKMPHQFVVLIHIFLLQGVKVAATEEINSHHRRRNTLAIFAHLCTRDENHVLVVTAPTADRLFMFMFNKIRFSTMIVSDLKQTTALVRLWVKTGMEQMECLDVGLCGTATHGFGIFFKVKPKKDNDRAVDTIRSQQCQEQNINHC